VNRDRLFLLGGAVVAAAVIVIVLVIVGTGGGSGTTTTSAVTDTTTSTQPSPISTFAGIPQHGDTLGKATAPATLLVFEDPQCPYCKQFNLETLPTVVNDFVRTGRVKLVWRGINIIGPNSEPALRAIFAAGDQNKLWQMAEAVYERQGAEGSGWVTTALLTEAATAARAKSAAILSGSSSSAVTAMLKNAESEAAADAIRGTPSFVLQRPPAVPQQLNVTSLDPAAFSAMLASALQ
jgi:protein-disulfide isomerase